MPLFIFFNSSCKWGYFLLLGYAIYIKYFSMLFSEDTKKLVVVIIKWIGFWCIGGKMSNHFFIWQIFQVYKQGKTLSCWKTDSCNHCSLIHTRDTECFKVPMVWMFVSYSNSYIGILTPEGDDTCVGHLGGTYGMMVELS